MTRQIDWAGIHADLVALIEAGYLQAGIVPGRGLAVVPVGTVVAGMEMIEDIERVKIMMEAARQTYRARQN